MSIFISPEHFEALMCGETIEIDNHKISLTKIGFEAIRESIEYAEQKQYTPVAIIEETNKNSQDGIED